MQSLTLDNLSRTLRDPRLLLTFVIFIGTLLGIVVYFTTRPQTPSWRGLTPEVTTDQQVEASFGKSMRKTTYSGYDVWFYKDKESNLFHQIWFQGNLVRLIKEQIKSKDERNFKDFQNLGKAKVFYSKLYADFQELKVFQGKGYAFLTNKNTGTLYEIWYFKPRSEKQFLQDFGFDLTRTPEHLSN